MPRQCVFVGTTNAAAYLHDPTGNRRFWPVKIGTIELDKVKTVIDQLWAEAVEAYRAGETWWLSPKLEKLAAYEQQGRLELDPWYDQIAEFVECRSPGTEFTTAQILSDLDVPKARRERVHEMRVGNILRELGCERRRVRGTGGRRRYVYCRGQVTEPELEEEGITIDVIAQSRSRSVPTVPTFSPGEENEKRERGGL